MVPSTTQPKDVLFCQPGMAVKLTATAAGGRDPIENLRGSLLHERQRLSQGCFAAGVELDAVAAGGDLVETDGAGDHEGDS